MHYHRHFYKDTQRDLFTIVNPRLRIESLAKRPQDVVEKPVDREAMNIGGTEFDCAEVFVFLGTIRTDKNEISTGNCCSNKQEK